MDGAGSTGFRKALKYNPCVKCCLWTQNMENGTKVIFSIMYLFLSPSTFLSGKSCSWVSWVCVKEYGFNCCVKEGLTAWVCVKEYGFNCCVNTFSDQCVNPLNLLLHVFLIVCMLFLKVFFFCLLSVTLNKSEGKETWRALLCCVCF